MKQEDIKRFRQQLNEIRENLSGIREQAASLSALLDEEKLIPSDIAQKLICALKEYQEKSAILQKTGQEISLSMSDRLSEIEDQLKTAEDKLKSAAEMELIRDYFRLTSEAEDARQQLETSKKKLQEHLRLNSDVYADEFNPYKLKEAVLLDLKTFAIVASNIFLFWPLSSRVSVIPLTVMFTEPGMSQVIPMFSTSP